MRSKSPPTPTPRSSYLTTSTPPATLGWALMRLFRNQQSFVHQTFLSTPQGFRYSKEEAGPPSLEMLDEAWAQGGSKKMRLFALAQGPTVPVGLKDGGSQGFWKDHWPGKLECSLSKSFKVADSSFSLLKRGSQNLEIALRLRQR